MYNNSMLSFPGSLPIWQRVFITAMTLRVESSDARMLKKAIQWLNIGVVLSLV